MTWTPAYKGWRSGTRDIPYTCVNGLCFSQCVSGLPKKDAAKMGYALKMLSEDPFATEVAPKPVILEARRVGGAGNSHGMSPCMVGARRWIGKMSGLLARSSKTASK